VGGEWRGAAGVGASPKLKWRKQKWQNSDRWFLRSSDFLLSAFAVSALPFVMHDVEQNRKSRKYSRGELARRVLWGAVKPFFRFSPRPCFGWRRFLLRCFGARIGREVHIYNSTVIYYPWNLDAGDYCAIGEQVFLYNLGPVTIGPRATISHRAHLCAGTHDHTKADFPLMRLPIVIGAQAWICADAFVGPGVTIGEGAILGARAVAMKDVEPWMIAIGNPARVIKRREPVAIAETAKAEISK
jgi:putative colanic acid biosynthesis acetyltransferase WcaF